MFNVDLKKLNKIMNHSLSSSKNNVIEAGFVKLIWLKDKE